MRRLRTERSNVLTVSDLQVKVQTKEGATTLVQDINFELEKGKVLGLVGENRYEYVHSTAS
jgi:nickel transport system ATP-binding protein